MQETGIISPEEFLGPPKIDSISVGLSVLSALIAGFVGGIFILICTVLFLNATKLSSPGAFPYVFSLVGFFAILLSVYLNIFLARLIFPNKYRGDSMTSFGQTFAFSVILFIVITPLYIYMNSVSAEKLIIVFVFHILLSIIGVSLITEILANYRYVLLSVYGSFLGFFVSSALSVVFFEHYQASDIGLYSLIAVIIVANVVTTTLHRLFELAYYRFYKATGVDPLGDIFARIENEERILAKQAEKELTTFGS